MQPARGATASLLLGASELGAVLRRGSVWAQGPSGPVRTQPTLFKLGGKLQAASGQGSQKGLPHPQS